MWGGGVYQRETVDSTSSKAKTLYKVSGGQFIYNRMFAWGGAFGVVPKDWTVLTSRTSSPSTSAIPNACSRRTLACIFSSPTSGLR